MLVVPGLSGPRLLRVADTLTFEEAKNLGYQLRLNQSFIEKINEQNKNMTPSDFALEILLQYRGKRPYPSQVQRIVKALRQIDRADLVDAFTEVEDIRDSDYM